MTTTLRLLRAIIAVLRGLVAFRACDSAGRLCRASFGWPDIVNGGAIYLGARVWLASSYAPVRMEALPGGSLSIGDRTGVNYGASITAGSSVSIGADVSIAPYCVITDTVPGRGRAADAVPVVIEDGCWLATRVVVGPGARIGRNSVITAGTHVTGTVEPDVVYGGAPARVLRRLDANEDGRRSLQQVLRAGLSEPVPEQPLVAKPSPAKPAAPRVGPVRRALLIADFTNDPLAGFLDGSEEGPRIAAEVAPFDQVVPTLLAPPDEVDIAVVWTRPDGSLSALGDQFDGEPVSQEQIEDDVDAFAKLIVARHRDSQASSWRPG